MVFVLSHLPVHGSEVTLAGPNRSTQRTPGTGCSTSSTTLAKTNTRGLTMTTRRFAFALCAVIALAVTACGGPRFGHRHARGGWFQRGEGRGGWEGRDGPMGHGGMMAMQDPIARLLDHQADLRLTTAQVE